MAQEFGNPFAARFGSSLGLGLGSGLQNIAQQRLNEMAQQRQLQFTQQQQMQQRGQYAQTLMGLGVPVEQAIALSGLPEKERLALFQRGGLAQPGGEQPSGVSQLLGQLGPSAQAGVTQGFQQVSPERAADLQKVQQTTQAQRPGGSFLEAMARPSPAEAATDRRHQEKLSQKTQLESNKETLAYHKEINQAAKAAKDSNVRLARMEELNSSGKLGSEIYNSLLKNASKSVLGIDLTSLMTADAQEFDKLSTDFLKDAKAIFGSRITDNDLNAFLKTIPTLNQSKEGRDRVISNLRAFNEAALLRQKAMRQVIQENKGNRPSNIDELVDERISGPMDQLAAKFASGAKTDIQPQQQVNVGQKLAELPNPSLLPTGAVIRDSKTGKFLINTGSSWQERK